MQDFRDVIKDCINCLPQTSPTLCANWRYWHRPLRGPLINWCLYFLLSSTYWLHITYIKTLSATVCKETRVLHFEHIYVHHVALRRAENANLAISRLAKAPRPKKAKCHKNKLFLWFLQFTKYSVSHPYLCLVKRTNINWQKMSHLGSPTNNKRCAILKVGMFAVVTAGIIYYYYSKILFLPFLVSKHFSKKALAVVMIQLYS